MAAAWTEPVAPAELVHLPGEALDLDVHLGECRGWALVHRLVYVARHCPALRRAAARRAADAIQEHTDDVGAYRQAVALHNTLPDGAPAPGDELLADEAWAERTAQRVRAEREKLSGELRMYQNNMISESVRMAHCELGDHCRRTGELDAALFHFQKAREYCASNEHALDTCLRALQTAWELGQHALVLSLADKCESLLHSLHGAAVALPGTREGRRAALAHGGAEIGPGRGGTPGASAIGALFRAGGSAPARAAPTFTSARDAPGMDEEEGDASADLRARIQAFRVLAEWATCDADAELPPAAVDAEHARAYADVVGMRALAWYAVLGAMSASGAPAGAKASRAAQLAEDPHFRHLAETDAAPREMLSAYVASNWRRCLAILEERRAALQLDMTLGVERARHMLDTITHRALARYLSAFRRVALGRMADTFGWSATQLAEHLVALALAGKVHVAIDWPAQTIEVLEEEPSSLGTLIERGQETAVLRSRLALAANMTAAGVCVRR